MAKIHIRTRDEAVASGLPDAYSGAAHCEAYFDGEQHPLHLHVIDLAEGACLRIEKSSIDQLAYVWRGGVVAGGQPLPQGSSLIVEHGRDLEIVGAEPRSTLLAFSAARPPASPRPGGNVHLLPADRAPRSDALGGVDGLGGAMHADADCPTCELWLHENRFRGTDARPQSDEAGVHSHTEDEIIFVIDGELRLGSRLYGPGAALSIPANTLYSFSPGPSGLHFVNFRAAKPGDIRFAKGPAMSETDYWREKLPRPAYLAPTE